MMSAICGQSQRLSFCASLRPASETGWQGSAGHSVDWWPLLGSPPVQGGVDVVMAGHLRPVSRQHALAVGIDLDVPDYGHASALQAEREAADAGE
jgi:hypothetical protein